MSDSPKAPDLPPPLTPANADLRSMPWFPHGVGDFSKLKYWLACKKNPAVGFYLVNLINAAWHDIPAGSIEDDDDILANAAMCSPDEWPKIKDAALAGFTLCADRRWYSNYLAPKVVAALDQKSTQVARTRNATEARKRLRESPAPISSINNDSADVNVTSTSHDRDEDATSPSTSPDEKKQEERKNSDATHRTGGAPVAPPPGDLPPPTPPPPRTCLATQEAPTFDARKALFEEGLSTLARITGRSEKALRAYVGKALSEVRDDAAVVLAIIRECAEVQRADPLAYVSKAVRERATPKRKTLEEEMREAIGLGEPPPGVAGVILDYADFEVLE